MKKTVLASALVLGAVFAALAQTAPDSAAKIPATPLPVAESPAPPPATDSLATLPAAGPVIDTVRATPSEKVEKKTLVRTKNKDEETEVITTYKGSVNQLRSPKKAFFLSFIMPGLGEYYARAGWPRVAIPAALEVASYISIYLIRQNYGALVDTFEAFANKHYSHDKFLSLYRYIRDSDTSVANWTTDDFGRYFNHPPDDIKQGSSDYYEMIAKYDEFVQGWDDATPDMVSPYKDSAGTDPYEFSYIRSQKFGSDQDARLRGLAIDHLIRADGNVVDTAWLFYHDDAHKRPRYFGYSANQIRMMDLRTTANEAGDKIMIVFYAMLLNRMVSAVDAVLAANAFNRRITGNTTTYLDRIHIHPIRVGVTDIPSNGAAVSYRF
ncbi:MAG: hypothetical protein V1913_17180 [Fibrobacterota bacterium]